MQASNASKTVPNLIRQFIPNTNYLYQMIHLKQNLILLNIKSIIKNNNNNQDLN